LASGFTLFDNPKVTVEKQVDAAKAWSLLTTIDLHANEYL